MSTISIHEVNNSSLNYVNKISPIIIVTLNLRTDKKIQI